MKLAKILLIFVANSVAHSCKTAGGQGASETRAILGINTLQTVPPPTNRDLHVLLNNGQHNCNATIVGPRQVAAALHCIGDDPQSFAAMTVSAASAQTKIVDIFFLDSTKDFVIYTTAAVFNFHYDIGIFDLNQPLRLFAYDPQTRDLKTTSCKPVRKLEQNSAFEHNCDSIKGFSGGALIQNGKMVGMHIGYNPKRQVNYALNISDVQNKNHIITDLEVDAELEWPHTRSPHVRTPHVRVDVSDLDPSRPVWDNDAAQETYCCTDGESNRCHEYQGNSVLIDAQYKATLQCTNRFGSGSVSKGTCNSNIKCTQGGSIGCSTEKVTVCS